MCNVSTGLLTPIAFISISFFGISLYFLRDEKMHTVVKVSLNYLCIYSWFTSYFGPDDRQQSCFLTFFFFWGGGVDRKVRKDIYFMSQFGRASTEYSGDHALLRTFLALLDYVSKAHEIEIRPSYVRPSVRPSVCGIDYLWVIAWISFKF